MQRLTKNSKKQIDIPQDYIDQIYNSKYMQYFYTDMEQSTFRVHWLGKKE